MATNNLADSLIRFFRESQRVLLGLVDTFDQSFLSVVTRLAPVLAPIPAAYSIYRAMVAIGAHYQIALVTAAAIELIGMFQSKTALRARNWNLVKLKSEPAAPFGLALIMAAIYFLTAFGLTLAIEFWPDKAHLIFPAFVIFAASVYVSNALASDLSRWETDRDDRLRGQQVKAGLAAEIKKLSGQVDRTRTEIKGLLANLASKGNELAALTGQVDRAKLMLAELASDQAEIDRELAAKGQKLADLESQLDRLNSQIREAKRGQFADQITLSGQFVPGDPASLDSANLARQARIEARRGRLVDLLAADSDLTNSQLADRLGVSESTIKTDKAALNGQLKR